MSIKTIIAGVLLIPALAIAEPVKVDKPVVCDTMENMLKYVMKEFGEQPIWIGQTQNGHQSALFLNTTTSTWSFLTATGTLTCLLESGLGFQLRAASGKKEENI